MDISVIITTFNRPNTLARVLQGLQNQTRPANEVIVADDGSGQETGQTVREFVPQFPCPLIHEWQDDLGFRAARIRNQALRKSSGDYIILLDGDCIPSEHFIEDHLILLEKGFFFQGKRILVSQKLSETFTHEDANCPWKLLKSFFGGNIGNGHHIIRVPIFPAYSTTKLSGIRSCNMGFFREDIFAVNGFNEDFVGWGREDSELAVRFYQYGLRRKEHPFMAICFHLWHDENDKNRLAVNDELLRKAIESDEYVCSKGLASL
ncbi:MAG: glycosyltransferase family 2 protein [Deltaproteobacteria bacterium]|nr:glycosyltransferase family 2 protein [Deltaproteobacteria bacterium]MBW2170586.1 glycosyltransferase family 2 protein [Deltaproteobacteria bacterium]